MHLDKATGELRLSILYFGCRLAGKRSNLRWLAEHASPPPRLVEFDDGRTLVFWVGEVGEYPVRAQIHTLPPGVKANATTKLTLLATDAVVFVVDTQPERLEANRDALDELEELLASVNKADVPLVVQYNKRDLPDAAPIEECSPNRPDGDEFRKFEAVAVEGRAVFDTLDAALALAVSRAERRLQDGTLVPELFPTRRG